MRTCIAKMCYLCTRIYTNNVKYMKKIVTSLAVALAATSAFAGGLLTTTNQNAHSLRFFAQDADINLTSLYANPAGQAFLNKGWHISASAMTAMQSRTIQSTFPLFALNQNNNSATHTFKGEAFAPVVPSFNFAYVQDKWSISARFGVVAGGGTCEFEDGLGSLEALTIKNGIAGIAQKWAEAAGPATVMGYMQQGMSQAEAMAKMQQDAAVYGQQNFKSYTVNPYMKGTQNYFGFQVGGTYKFLDNLSAYVGVRGVFASCAYVGGIKDVTVNGQETGTNMSLDCQQSGFGVTPIIGIHYRPIKGLEIAAKYEFMTKINLTNKTTPESADVTEVLPLYKEGMKVRTDMPALLNIGAQYRPIENVKVAASWRYYFDKGATKDGYVNGEKVNMNDLIDNNTMEFLASAEWKFCKWVAASFSWQNTSYGLSDAYMSDTDFNLSSNSIGTGLRIYPCKLLTIDLGYMHTFYKDRAVTDANGINNLYSRTNDVVGVGLNFAF